jgi:hypothetical protein
MPFWVLVGYMITVRQLSLVFLTITALPFLAQGDTSIDDFLARLPAVSLRENGPQRYLFTCDYLYFALDGKLTHKQRVSGNYTRNLPEGKAKWDNVRIANATNFDDAFPQGDPQTYMDGFSYNPSTAGEFKTGFFAGFPDNMQTKTLVWDVSMFEFFAWKYFDALKLNEPFEIQPSDVSLPGGKFHNRRPVLTWVGVSKMNGKLCAVIEYQAFFNRLSMASQGQTLEGRSDYWGTIWVSLNDKEIEKGTLNEGVLLGFEIPGQPGKQAVSVFRQATFERRSPAEKK